MKIPKDSKAYVAGDNGLLGSVIERRLDLGGYTNLMVRTHQELDLLDRASVNAFFASEKPEYIFLAAAMVGGIQANNTYPAEFIYESLMVQNNVMHAAHKEGAKWFCFLGSNRICPCDCPQPMKEEYFLSEPLEKTNESYALAKTDMSDGIAFACEDFLQKDHH